MAAISTIIAAAAVAASAGGAVAANRNARAAQRQAGQAAEAGAAAADPASGMRPFFQDQLGAMWPNLSGVNYAQILQDPSFQFLKNQGETAAINQASAGGLLRSGTLLEDLSKFNQDLASTYVDKQFARNMSMLGILGNFSGLNIGNPGQAGSIIATGGMQNAINGYNMGVNTQNNVGAAISQIGRLFNNSGSSGYSTGGTGNWESGTPGGNWSGPG